MQIVNRAYRVLTYICYQNNAATTCLLYRTKKAMGGSVPFHEALSTRLGLIQPSLQQIADFIRPRLCNPEVVLTPGVRWVKLIPGLFPPSFITITMLIISVEGLRKEANACISFMSFYFCTMHLFPGLWLQCFNHGALLFTSFLEGFVSSLSHLPSTWAFPRTTSLPTEFSSVKRVCALTSNKPIV